MTALQQLENDINHLVATRRIAGLAIGIIQAGAPTYVGSPHETEYKAR